MEILVKNVKKTADGIKLFLAIFERTYYGTTFIEHLVRSLLSTKLLHKRNV